MQHQALVRLRRAVELNRDRAWSADVRRGLIGDRRGQGTRHRPRLGQHVRFGGRRCRQATRRAFALPNGVQARRLGHACIARTGECGTCAWGQLHTTDVSRPRGGLERGREVVRGRWSGAEGDEHLAQLVCELFSTRSSACDVEPRHLLKQLNESVGQIRSANGDSPDGLGQRLQVDLPFVVECASCDQLGHDHTQRKDVRPRVDQLTAQLFWGRITEDASSTTVGRTQHDITEVRHRWLGQLRVAVARDDDRRR